MKPINSSAEDIMILRSRPEVGDGIEPEPLPFSLDAPMEFYNLDLMENSCGIYCGQYPGDALITSINPFSSENIERPFEMKFKFKNDYITYTYLPDTTSAPFDYALPFFGFFPCAIPQPQTVSTDLLYQLGFMLGKYIFYYHNDEVGYTSKLKKAIMLTINNAGIKETNKKSFVILGDESNINDVFTVRRSDKHSLDFYINDVKVTPQWIEHTGPADEKITAYRDGMIEINTERPSNKQTLQFGVAYAPTSQWASDGFLEYFSFKYLDEQKEV